MKFELDHRDRAYLANLLRRRASETLSLAKARSTSANQREFEIEAECAEQFAKRLDGGDPDSTLPSPITSDQSIVDTYIDKKATQ